MSDWVVGEKIEVIDLNVVKFPTRGTIVEVDLHPTFGDSYAKIRIDDSPTLPIPEVWVNLRLARKI
jgi:hypothetical protein